MIKKIEIDGFKNIQKEALEFSNLNILTGINSSGKSSIIQGLLMLSHFTTNSSITKEIVKNLKEFEAIRNKYERARKIELVITTYENKEYKVEIEADIFHGNLDSSSIFSYEKNLFYISANRTGQEDIAKYDDESIVGVNGEYIFGYFERVKDTKIDDLLIKDNTHHTLDAQLTYWFKFILDIDIRLRTEKITQSNVKVVFDIDGINGLSPFNVGAGNSYLAKILIVGLMLKKNNIFIVENPEIHLHPKAQARLADFFAFLAKNGIQVIIETHSEHLINKLRYLIYKKELLSDSVKIFYKDSIKDNFTKIFINKNGHFVNKNGEKIDFPSGFFDSTLSELLEIG